MKKIVKALVGSLVIALLLSGAGFASDSGSGKKSGHSERHENKFYGTVEKLPQDIPGTWVVDGKEVLVTKDTIIEEDHGKPAAGAYVEIEGSYSGSTFIARKIEIKGRHK